MGERWSYNGEQGLALLASAVPSRALWWHIGLAVVLMSAVTFTFWVLVSPLDSVLLVDHDVLPRRPSACVLPRPCLWLPSTTMFVCAYCIVYDSQNCAEALSIDPHLDSQRTNQQTQVDMHSYMLITCDVLLTSIRARTCGSLRRSSIQMFIKEIRCTSSTSRRCA